MGLAEGGGTFGSIVVLTTASFSWWAPAPNAPKSNINTGALVLDGTEIAKPFDIGIEGDQVQVNGRATFIQAEEHAGPTVVLVRLSHINVIIALAVEIDTDSFVELFRVSWPGCGQAQGWSAS